VHVHQYADDAGRSRRGGGVRVKQDFTDAKVQLLEEVQKLVFGEV
jgi:hypothetical protein